MVFKVDLQEVIQKKIKSLERRQQWIDMDICLIKAATGKNPKQKERKGRKIIKLDQIDMFAG